MPSTALNAQGTTVQVDNLTPGTPDTTVTNVKTFSGFDGEVSEIDITNLASTAKEFSGGLQDFGSFSMEWDIDYSDGGQNLVRSAQASGAVKTFLLTFPNGDTAQFASIVKNAQAISGGVDQVLTGSVSLKITGAVTFA
jgi:hypothetical protein